MVVLQLVVEGRFILESACWCFTAAFCYQKQLHACSHLKQKPFKSKIECQVCWSDGTLLSTVEEFGLLAFL